MKPLCLVLVVFGLGILSGNAASKNTANYIRSQIDRYDGAPATIDVVSITRINLDLADHKDIALFAVHTIDERNLTDGGTLLAIVDVSMINSLIDRYGTSVDRTGGKMRIKSMSGTIGRIKHEGQEDIVFINLSSMKNPETLPITRTEVVTTSHPAAN